MKTIIQIIIATLSVAALAGCVEDDSYSSTYYSRSGYVKTSNDNMHSGYNRDYQKRDGYSSDNKPKNDGYYSDNNPKNNGYPSDNNPPQ